MDENRMAEVAKALAHPARVQIVGLLSAQTECRGADVFGVLPLAQSTVSEHLRVLREAGIVSSRSEGATSLYCIVPDALSEYQDAIGGLVGRAMACGCGTGRCGG